MLRLLGESYAWISFVPASLLLVAAYSTAAAASTSTYGHFHLFWAGMLVFALPVAARLLQRSTPVSERLALVAFAGLFCYLPKVLRTPDGPLFHDEMVHWYQVESVRTTGELFTANPTLDVISGFPGLHGATAWLPDIVGTSGWWVGLTLIGVAHVASLVGIFVLARATLSSDRAAGVAAFVYALNPSFLYFDAQFAYESVAIALFIWVLAALASGVAAKGVARRAWLGVMSDEPPPSAKRLPLAKSAPSRSADTNAEISAGSAEPSASSGSSW